MSDIRKTLKAEAEIKESLLDQVIRLQAERDEMKAALIKIAEWWSQRDDYTGIQEVARETLKSLGVPFGLT